MHPKRSKYDTNPLDEKVGHRAEESFGLNRPAAQTEDFGGVTHPIARNAPETSRASIEGEAPTRLISDKVTSYPSVFVPPPPRPSARYAPPPVDAANIYQPPPVPLSNIYQPPPLPLARPGSHTVAGLNIPERWANMLPYTPAYIGLVIAVIELFLVPRSDTRSRFHAAQGLALHLAILIGTVLFAILGLATRSGVGSGIFRSAAFIFLIVSMVRAWKGRPHHIAPLDDATKWLDRKIGPKKS